MFTTDLIETWISLKREQEIAPVNLRPHPYEFSAVLRLLSLVMR